MSGIAAIIRFDGQSADPRQLVRMTDAMAFRGPDGITHWSRDGVALGHLLLNTTAESLDEKQPLLSEDGAVALIMDGYLANYDDLRRDLLSRGAVLRSPSDAELVLRAYETWGSDCPIHLQGEFAFVIWDERRHEAFCANDHGGMRGLHYHWDGKRLLVASDPAGILATADFEARPNPQFITQVIGNEYMTRDETAWVGVMRLSPAKAMPVDARGPRLIQYWMPPLEVTIRYARDEEYAEHYREIVDRSVRAAARSHRPVACEVSGGLDSSAVFCIAHDLHRSGQISSPALKGYTYDFAGAGEADELEYVEAVVQQSGQPITKVQPWLPELDWYSQRAREWRDLAPYPNMAMAVNTGRAAVADGCRVLLNGEGGDEWAGGHYSYYAEMLSEGDWRRLASSFRADVGDVGLAQSAWLLFRWGIGPRLPRFLLDLRQRLIAKDGPNTFRTAFWMTPQAQAMLTERRERFKVDMDFKVANLPRRGLLWNLIDPFLELVRYQISRQSAWVGYEVRSPLYTRPYVEFAFATPEHLRLRGGQRKYLHSAALSDLLPPSVANRRTKADFSIAFMRLLDNMEPRLLGLARGLGREFLDPAGVNRIVGDYHAQGWELKPIWELWCMSACEYLFEQGQIS